MITNAPPQNKKKENSKEGKDDRRVASRTRAMGETSSHVYGT